MRLRGLLSGIAIALGLSAPAIGADLKAPPVPPVYAPAYSWNGFYIGGNIGAASVNLDQTFSAFFADVAHGSTAGGSNPSESSTAFIWGGQAGVNWVYPNTNFLMGLELDVDDLSQSLSTVNPNSIGGLTTAKLNLVGTGRVRAGFTFGQWLLYATGGVAWDDTDLTIANASTATNTGVGWAAGAGVEYAVPLGWSPTSALVLRAQYLHYQIPGLDANLAASGLSGAGVILTTAAINANSTDKLDAFTFGASLKF